MKLSRGLDEPRRERYLTYCSYYRPSELDRLLNNDTPLGDPFRRHRAYLDRVRDEHWLTQLLYLDMKTFLPCLNLRYTDKMSMAASAEVRVPLLDDALVALSGQIPPELKLHRLARKYVFKQSMEGVLPQDVINRPKAGFGAPLRAWLVGDLEPDGCRVIVSGSSQSTWALQYGRSQAAARDKPVRSGGQLATSLALLTLELWQRAFLD